MDIKPHTLSESINTSSSSSDILYHLEAERYDADQAAYVHLHSDWYIEWSKNGA